MKIILFGSYLQNPEKANDVDIAIVTKYLHGGSRVGLFLAKVLAPILYPFYGKEVDIAVYSEGYLDSIDAMEKKYGPRRGGRYLKQSILSGRLLFKI